MAQAGRTRLAIASLCLIIGQLPPGDYTAFGFDGAESGAWQSPEFMAPYEGRGQPVRIAEGAPASVELIALPPAR